MIVTVVGGGRSGTNLTLEMMRGHSYFTASDVIEDKALFAREGMLKSGYLSKCDTWYCRSYEFLDRLMKMNSYIKMLFTIRHPYDMCLSKLYRGKGLADDSSIEGCIADMYHMYILYKRGIKTFPNDILLVKMEDVILDIEKEARRICDWLPLKFEKSMLTPHKRMRDKEKKKRYSALDKNQIDMWKNWKEIHDGFFTENKIDMEWLFDMVDPMVEYFRYEKK